MTLVDSLGADTYEYPISIHLGQALVSGLRYGILPIRACFLRWHQYPDQGAIRALRSRTIVYCLSGFTPPGFTSALILHFLLFLLAGLIAELIALIDPIMQKEKSTTAAPPTQHHPTWQENTSLPEPVGTFSSPRTDISSQKLLGWY
ncbi:hypothetical protein ASPNIDRAFT_35999 [Aspergillus niger ATCC 1015]|uniref:Uncharacterized protein n=1 Tax=Aspergillus niger (strain ATCC 1015 / CBS 113.46 / FGSC A1144 / LSHB Ac4 / NCTC 3858a / NRRL 328 / USDA 3528.7) TaxID=380704 RepID=G3XSV1_ASPNA|nr:hypothetical protein ASPNIDRAFT_35999 [Aspergillus niger ATCC 1015]